MSFTRYEIREYTWEDGEMTYSPYYSLSEAMEDAKNYSSSQYKECFICKITMYPTYEVEDRLYRINENGELEKI